MFCLDTCFVWKFLYCPCIPFDENGAHKISLELDILRLKIWWMKKKSIEEMDIL